MISYVHSATVIVDDQDKALDFYVNTLGFEKVIDQPMGPEMRFITVVPKGATTQIALALASWAGGSGTRGGESGISYITDDIDATYKELIDRGVRFKGPVEDMPWGDRGTWFYDIDENEFFLNEIRK